MAKTVDFSTFNARKNGIAMTISPDREDSTEISITLSGYLDNKNSQEFHTEINKHLPTLKAFTRVIFDVRELTYLSSTGVGVLHNILVEMERLGITFILFNPNEKIRSVLQLLGLYSFFTIKEDGGTR